MNEVIETSCGKCKRPLGFLVVQRSDKEEWEKFKMNQQRSNISVIGITFEKYLERKSLKYCECAENKGDSKHYKLAE